ncbi:hypothetical protein ACFQ9X_53795 [Catenulispora yoronensis]
MIVEAGMNVMTVSPVAPNHVTQNNEQRVVEEVVDIPQQQDAESTPNPEGRGPRNRSPR